MDCTLSTFSQKKSLAFKEFNYVRYLVIVTKNVTKQHPWISHFVRILETLVKKKLHTHTSSWANTHAHSYAYTYMRKWTCIHICVHTHMYTHRQTFRSICFYPVWSKFHHTLKDDYYLMFSSLKFRELWEVVRSVLLKSWISWSF